MKYCHSPFGYRRRKTREVRVGGVGVGGNNPIRVQSMLTSDTMNTEACVAEALPILDAGCEIIRLTAPTVNDARKLKDFVAALRARDYSTPVVADIHFKPEAAMEAVKWVEKIRVNPGNYADKKKFAVKEYTGAEYAAELAHMEAAFTPLVLECKRLGRAMRIGTNHGSLSDRILNRFGDTPAGMVESAMEFARICRKHDYHELVFSMKASNVKVVIAAYRLLAARLDEQGWDYPLHLGVTEAGEGEDGRIKSAVGIGALLEDGIGDTVRVSLTEDSVHEIPVARALVKKFDERLGKPAGPDFAVDVKETRDPFTYVRRPTREVTVNSTKLGGGNLIRVCVTNAQFDWLAPKQDQLGDTQPELVYERCGAVEVDPLSDDLSKVSDGHLVAVKDGLPLSPIMAYRILAAKLDARGCRAPILLKDVLESPAAGTDSLDAMLHAATMLGGLISDGIGDAILVRGEANAEAALRLAYNILQATGSRSFKAEYVACPSCGRTLFNLQTVTARIKKCTHHLKGVKIAVMGCIVNGPGEMADADFGYVGGAPGKVNLYVGKTCVKFNIPEAEAVDRLLDLIKEHGKWSDLPAGR
ncbi:MAG: (E)-4-hydroxy-3-methylbut-2-enyl-diphosphate synthase [Verrucomicrobia bacterium]|nr:(E)-4-hydroxy-3-methylbut-2-enyl-diphosphate synthase [Verrucomicrobiota bacterium]